MASLENRGNGSWRVTISNGYDARGKKQFVKRLIKVDASKTELSQRREVEKQAALIEADFRRHLLTDSKQITVSALFEDYIQDIVVRRGLAPATEESYRKLFNRKILPAFGKMAVQEITARDLNKFLRDLEAQGLAGTYSLKFYQQIHELMVYAQRSGYIAVNPCDLVEAPKRDTEESKFYEREEAIELLNKLIAWSDAEWSCFFIMDICTGMRPGELIGANWSDIKDNVFTVSAGSVQLKGEKCRRTDKPKTKKSIRKIDLPPVAVAALKRWRKKQSEYRLKIGPAWQDPDPIFTNEIGERVSIATPSRNWKKFTTANGIRHLPLKDLRHTHATILIYSGVNVRDVSARMGHSQASTTLNIYSHSFMDANSRATEAFVNALDLAE